MKNNYCNVNISNIYSLDHYLAANLECQLAGCVEDDKQITLLLHFQRNINSFPELPVQKIILNYRACAMDISQNYVCVCSKATQPELLYQHHKPFLAIFKNRLYISLSRRK